MTPNLYDELGVDRKATTPEIRKAYRRKAKQAHPDAPGGSRRKFDALSKALTILVDPKARATYDETGRIEEPAPDNRRAAALQIIEGHISAIVNNYLQNMRNVMADPRHMDLIATVKAKIVSEIVQAKAAQKEFQVAIDFLNDYASRFTTTESVNVMARAAMAQADRARAEIEKAKEAEESRNDALAILKNYDFRYSPYAPGHVTMWTV